MRISRLTAAISMGIALAGAMPMEGVAQTPREALEKFRRQNEQKFNSFRNACNKRYADFLRQSWKRFHGTLPVELPPEPAPIPPLIYEGEKENKTIIEEKQKPVIEEKQEPVIEERQKEEKPEEEQHEVKPKVQIPIDMIPVIVIPPAPTPQPQPLEPIEEIPVPVINENVVETDLYGIAAKVRFPADFSVHLSEPSNHAVADAWERLSDGSLDNTLFDCIALRSEHNLSDWAYLQLLDNVGKTAVADKNTSTLLTSYLFCQSGYRMRLGIDDYSNLYMLFSSPHAIFKMMLYALGEEFFYVYGPCEVDSLKICDAPFEGEKSLSLYIREPQTFGTAMSEKRTIASDEGLKGSADSQVSTGLIKFYETYPVSAIDGNVMTRWAMYADTPIDASTKEILYPGLKEMIRDCDTLTAANRLLDWVQHAFTYEYDEKVWGYDRAFFAEETLYYPYCDCEDRSILYSRLVRDLLGLDVALVYYPGHLATAVAFDNEVPGDAMLIDGRRFTVCDPTYIGAPVGLQMPNLDYDKTQAILLRR